MNKYMKTVGMTAALAVMIPLSAYAATSTTTTTSTDAKTSVSGTTAATAAKPGHEGRGGKGGFGGAKFVSDEVLALLKLDRAALQEKLAAGSTLAEIATAQGVTEEQLKAALTSAFEARQAEEKSNFTSNLDTYISSKQTMPEGGKAFGHGFGGNQLATVATALGLTEDALKEQLAAGKTIAALATEKGVDAATIITKVQAAIDAQIDQAVTDGKLTSEQATGQKAKSAEMATSIVNGEFAGKGFGGGRGHGGPRGDKGQAPSGTTSGQSGTTTSTTGTSA
ncbi:hypothetical protein [Paenibacillus methanolicus]|uniref:LysM domain-containing protein n=1 Tax=Paenibacillus methanolicus TaxID=582686 RepID=A0A5S5BQM5_9BACL|nr:hypothetical protein [Paenibacillus methanolicus]TYP68616.1 hypothetical protein BCM02_11812 [Paenibacillus methanolicus]